MKRLQRYLINIISLIIILSSTFTIISVVRSIFEFNSKMLLLALLFMIILANALFTLFLIHVYIDKKRRVQL